MRRLWVVLPLVYVLWYTLPREVQPDGTARFADFHICYYAALGDYEWEPTWATTDWNGWLYADWVAYLYKPFTLLPVGGAGWLFFMLSMCSYTYLLWRLSETNHGWIVGLATVKLAAWLIWVGNAGIVLAALSTTFLGSALAACIKPYLLCFVILNAYRTEARRWFNETA
jgi:hypothetical protein